MQKRILLRWCVLLCSRTRKANHLGKNRKKMPNWVLIGSVLTADNYSNFEVYFSCNHQMKNLSFHSQLRNKNCFKKKKRIYCLILPIVCNKTILLAHWINIKIKITTDLMLFTSISNANDSSHSNRRF